MHLSHAQLLSEPHDYDDVRVLLLTWQDVGEYDTLCTNTMKESFEYLDYEVQVAQILEIASWGGHDSWIGRHVQKFCDGADPSTLLVVYYLDLEA